jgi:hypothetical protein
VRVREYNNVICNCPKAKEESPSGIKDLENQLEGRRGDEEKNQESAWGWITSN